MEHGSNGFDGDQLGQYLGELDKADDELLKLKSEHMIACKAPRARIKAVMKEARAAGLNMAAFRVLVNDHRSARKIDEQIAELERQDADDYEAMCSALGKFADTPLGEAALKKAKEKEDALNGLAAG